MARAQVVANDYHGVINRPLQRVCRNGSTFVVSEGWGARFDGGDYWASLDRREDFTHGFKLFETL